LPLAKSSRVARIFFSSPSVCARESPSVVLTRQMHKPLPEVNHEVAKDLASLSRFDELAFDAPEFELGLLKL
jgi:hypothetical protein